MLNFAKVKDTSIEIEGVPVLIRSLTAGELARVLHSVDAEKSNGTPWRADMLLVALTVMDPFTGKLAFAGVNEVEAECPGTVAQLVQACVRHNQLGAGEGEAKKKSSAKTR